jgi:hypothetical protein
MECGDLEATGRKIRAMPDSPVETGCVSLRLELFPGILRNHPDSSMKKKALPFNVGVINVQVRVAHRCHLFRLFNAVDVECNVHV